MSSKTQTLPIPALLFAGCFLILLYTTALTIYITDSAELVTGAYLLGIVHAPGYSLYTLLAHVFTYLPLGEVAYRVNLLSTLSLALTVPFLYSLINHLVKDRLVSLAAVLSFAWSYYVWMIGITAEVYAPQLLSLSILLWALVRLYQSENRSARQVYFIGLWLGTATALNPSSVLFAPGVVVALLYLRMPLRVNLIAAAISTLIFLTSLLYFPLRYEAGVTFTSAGEYNAAGEFEQVDLTTPYGIWWLVSGRQFESLFFAKGYIPSLGQLHDLLRWYWGNFLGIGLLLGIGGLYHLFRLNRKLLLIWLAFFLPYTYFYTTYAAIDRETMLTPSYLLWSIAIAYGICRLVSALQGRFRLIALGLPLLLLIVNLPLLNIREDRGLYDAATRSLRVIPENAYVFGSWTNIHSIQYLCYVENQREDLKIYNLFYFPAEQMQTYVDNLLREGKPVVFLGASDTRLDRRQYAREILWVEFDVEGKPVVQVTLISRVQLQGSSPP